MKEQINIMTFDIEEWFHFDFYCTEDKWMDQETRLNLYLPRVLDDLDKQNIKATFFCLGWMVRTYPDIIKHIQSRGHGFACHSDKHLFVREMTPEAFDKDLKESLASIEDVIGEKVTAFRAPSFSISEDSIWAFEVLASNGITTDCSIFPTGRNFGGFPSFGKAVPTLLNYRGYSIKEFPITVGRFLGKEMVFSGGGYFRLFPYGIIKSQMQKLDYNMTYLHMRDFDYQQPRMKHLSLPRKFKSYYGLKGAYPKFTKMLHDFEWVSLDQAIEKIDFDNVPVLNLK